MTGGCSRACDSRRVSNGPPSRAGPGDPVDEVEACASMECCVRVGLAVLVSSWSEGDDDDCGDAVTDAPAIVEGKSCGLAGLESRVCSTSTLGAVCGGEAVEDDDDASARREGCVLFAGLLCSPYSSSRSPSRGARAKAGRRGDEEFAGSWGLSRK
ncbi:MAG: hypothetical protein Q9212_004804, partial [Teloschistes hypoglaucus]